MDEHLQDAQRRKHDHLRLAGAGAVQRPGRGTGLESFDFEPTSLPELALDAVDTRVELFGVGLRAPLLIGAMTGGSTEAGAVNRILAAAAERCRVGLCLGSQRPMLDGNAEAAKSFCLRDVAPTALLLGNLGAIQLRDAADGALDRLAQAVQADAMMVHLNPLQEAVQPEGDRDWRGVHAAIAAAASGASVPVLVKEVGAGLSASTLELLARTGIAGVETAGVGGTSWARIESLRHEGRTPRAIAGEVLADFGTPTAQSIVAARHAFPGRIVIGSGGLRDGLQAAKCIALGADAVALAWPMLQALRSAPDAASAVEAVVNEIEGLIVTLRTVMFLVGAPTISHLAATPLLARP